MPLQISGEHRRAFTVIRIVGEVDKTAESRLREKIDEALASASPRLLFDLSSMNFIDSCGLRLLVQASSRAHRCGGTCALCCPKPSTRRLMRLTGLDAAFDVYPTLGDALAEARPESPATARLP
ncbi:anti-sigma factor antagonist [Planomonospora sphaerica]|uniref:Anti-sigma factor antagonist n=1 Tax=Planomonospora sphaerica TaxID=161355 RepID=A0A161M6R1_9ACTN|nr:STAS domain-containing protein [Planomonospora sphaerica]GAT64443.1 anti-sigma factor antagonist [Planomonospora sphaerica]